MKYRLRIEVSLKPGHGNPEGEITSRLLRELGYKVEAVSVSKVYRIDTVSSRSRKEVEAEAEEMCKRLLANPTKDNYAVAIEEEG